MTFLKVTQDLVLATQIAQNVYWLTVSPDVGVADETQVLADVSAWLKLMYEKLTVNISDVTAYGGYRVDKVDPLTNEETFYVEGDALITDGSSTAQRYASGVAAQLNGTVLGTAHGPRKFIAGFSEGAVLADSLTGTIITNLALFGAEWLAGPTDGTLTWVSGMWSRTDLAFYGMLAVEVLSLVGYQRRRKPGVGM